MTETAFRVVVAGLYDRVATDPPITATDIKHGLLDLGFDGVTVTPMDDALIKAAEAMLVAVTFTAPPKEFNEVLCYEARIPVEFEQELRAAIANARGDTK